MKKHHHCQNRIPSVKFPLIFFVCLLLHFASLNVNGAPDSYSSNSNSNSRVQNSPKYEKQKSQPELVLLDDSKHERVPAPIPIPNLNKTKQVDVEVHEDFSRRILEEKRTKKYYYAVRSSDNEEGEDQNRDQYNYQTNLAEDSVNLKDHGDYDWAKIREGGKKTSSYPPPKLSSHNEQSSHYSTRSSSKNHKTDFLGDEDDYEKFQEKIQREENRKGKDSPPPPRKSIKSFSSIKYKDSPSTVYPSYGYPEHEYRLQSSFENLDMEFERDLENHENENEHYHDNENEHYEEDAREIVEEIPPPSVSSYSPPQPQTKTPNPNPSYRPPSRISISKTVKSYSPPERIHKFTQTSGNRYSPGEIEREQEQPEVTQMESGGEEYEPIEPLVFVPMRAKSRQKSVFRQQQRPLYSKQPVVTVTSPQPYSPVPPCTQSSSKSLVSPTYIDIRLEKNGEYSTYTSTGGAPSVQCPTPATTTTTAAPPPPVSSSSSSSSYQNPQLPSINININTDQPTQPSVQSQPQSNYNAQPNVQSMPPTPSYNQPPVQSSMNYNQPPVQSSVNYNQPVVQSSNSYQQPMQPMVQSTVNYNQAPSQPAVQSSSPSNYQPSNPFVQSQSPSPSPSPPAMQVNHYYQAPSPAPSPPPLVQSPLVSSPNRYEYENPNPNQNFVQSPMRRQPFVTSVPPVMGGVQVYQSQSQGQGQGRSMQHNVMSSAWRPGFFPSTKIEDSRWKPIWLTNPISRSSHHHPQESEHEHPHSKMAGDNMRNYDDNVKMRAHPAQQQQYSRQIQTKQQPQPQQQYHGKRKKRSVPTRAFKYISLEDKSRPQSYSIPILSQIGVNRDKDKNRMINDDDDVEREAQNIHKSVLQQHRRILSHVQEDEDKIEIPFQSQSQRQGYGHHLDSSPFIPSYAVIDSDFVLIKEDTNTNTNANTNTDTNKNADIEKIIKDLDDLKDMTVESSPILKPEDDDTVDTSDDEDSYGSFNRRRMIIPSRLSVFYNGNPQHLHSNSGQNRTENKEKDDSSAESFHHTIDSKKSEYHYEFTAKNGIDAKESGFMRQVEPGTGAETQNQSTEAGRLAVVKVGSVNFKSPEGVYVSLNYEADEQGFRPVKSFSHPSSISNP